MARTRKMTSERAELADWYRKLDEAYNSDELQSLCFDLEVDHDNLAGETKRARIGSLLQEVPISDILPLVKESRSYIDWESVSPDQPDLTDEEWRELFGPTVLERIWDNVYVIGGVALVLIVIGVLGSRVIANQTGPEVMPDGKLLNIAVAEFGELVDGTVVESQTGRDVSAMIYNRLCDEFLEPEEICDPTEDEPTSLGESYGDGIALWHDSMPLALKGAELGRMAGATAEERAVAAEALADRINANIVIYGYVENIGGNDTIYTEVFFRGDKTRSEVDAIAGTHEIGVPIALQFPAENENRPGEIRKALEWRMKALAWITAGLTEDVANNRADALATFQQAADELSDWDDDRGQAALHYFIGRQAFFLREYDTAFDAFETALRHNPSYPNANLALGATHFDFAQLHFLRGLADFESDCVDEGAIMRSAETLEQAEASILKAQTFFVTALQEADKSPYPELSGVAHMMMGQNQRLSAALLVFRGENDLARDGIAVALSEFETAQTLLTGTNEYIYRGMTFDGMGGTWETLANLEERDTIGKDPALAKAAANAAWGEAQQSYEMCLAEEEQMPPELFDLMAKNNVFNCGCRANLEFVTEKLEQE